MGLENLNGTHHNDTSTLRVPTSLVLGIVEHGRVSGQTNDHSTRLFSKDKGETRSGIEALPA